jgi:putative ABC transport system substrate-binding protein
MSKFRKCTGVIALIVAFVICGAVAHTQQPTKVFRIGYLTSVPLSANAARYEAFLQRLRELGYVQEKNIAIELRSAEGKVDRVPALAAELVRLKVDVIVTGGGTDTGAAKKATNTIPVVMTQDSDPVGSGYVTTLARPGGNITGLSTLAAQISGKRLELLKEIIPKLSRVAVLGMSTRPGNAQSLKEVELAAEAFKVQVQYVDVLDIKDIEPAFRAATNGRADAILVLQSPLFISNRTQIVDLAAKNRLPTIYPQIEYMEDDGLIYYGANYADLFRRAATYVDKILKGAKPADLPVEQPTKFELLINLNTAKEIGLTIPANVLARADRVIR